MQRVTERIRCQHADLSEQPSRSPTHTFAAKYRKFFLRTRIYIRDKANLWLRVFRVDLGRVQLIPNPARGAPIARSQLAETQSLQVINGEKKKVGWGTISDGILQTRSLYRKLISGIDIFHKRRHEIASSQFEGLVIFRFVVAP